MPAIYERQTIQWEEDALNRLVAEGQATFFEKPGTYVVKLPEGGSVAVRPEQILRSGDRERLAREAREAQEAIAALAQAEMLGGSSYTVAELAEAESLEAQIRFAQGPEPRGIRPVTEHSHFSKEADDLIARFTKKG